MKVVDFLKKKKEILAQHQFDLIDLKERIPPVLLDHWAEFLNRANNIQIVNWAREHQLLSTDESNTQTKTVEASPIVLPEKAQTLLAELSAQLNEEIHLGQWLTVDQDRIDKFAQVTEDQQWIHTDPKRARSESPFKTTIAHGFLTLSLLPVLTESVDESQSPYPGVRMTVNYGLNEVRFLYPVKAGSRVRARTTLKSVTPIKRGLEVVKEIKVEIEGTRRPACLAQTVIRLYF
ncbi:MaoC family dehydratase [Celerinatantimonas sp. MCCC 1A17872]|uniref:MaoC family dehydratase n=1 Tax=Celerinatantimonas sp. MCCC 1A17872 TaxID=3177514 RepID=UPI0038CBCB58